MRGFGAALAAALSAAVLAACGEESGGVPQPPPSDPLSRVEFLEQADAICHSTEARIEAAADDLLRPGRDPRPGAVERVALTVVVPALETEVRAIRSLGAPAGDEAEVEAILAATERGIAAIGADPRGLADRVPAPLREAERLASAYGSRQCGLR